MRSNSGAGLRPRGVRTQAGEHAETLRLAGTVHERVLRTQQPDVFRQLGPMVANETGPVLLMDAGAL